MAKMHKGTPCWFISEIDLLGIAGEINLLIFVQFGERSESHVAASLLGHNHNHNLLSTSKNTQHS